MARGWESKSVEDQVQQSQSSGSGKRKSQATPGQLEVRRRRQVLLLSKVRVQRDLDASQNPRYRDQLSRALADIESQLSMLEDAG
ncbi:MAG TPA: hypothetical protein VMM16_04665 [Verrucomicrobiae bacterium]|nr:hypothetical protein [Verrucomicrobiae bacterium]